MAVYTEIDRATLAQFLEGYDIGPCLGFDGILQGIENSNFRLETPAGRYVLTVFERRATAADLPYFLALMAHLADAGFPAP
ncbi:MAG: phosphotransferase, partial [Alphaproteobacteria bacterium]